MSGFCNSTGTLRGPGSVPPRPGRIGCGVPDGAFGVCALAAATLANPTAAVLRTVRRERLILLSPFVTKAADSEWRAAVVGRQRRDYKTGAPEPARRAGSARQRK